ncbi:MAG: hypothetical protein AMJ46_07635 [Latescibacteria bacterium DG_63]|uniref:Porin domain-containing protein n=1 Tax=candidate division TA06 bacterium SM1_40 TaxID=1703773 RepID=A0A0S8JM93_UNCT6|nr:MAG: hypothetical protein AMJ46_07635 [Latescibacteria bacterium DG_63]KPL10776.1 MAG: hypothetical protein AMJ71_01890 [candidate division TA06 bacterium SM1_40]
MGLESMCRLVVTVTLATLLLLPRAWGIGPELSGYYQYQLTAGAIDREAYVQDYNRLRLDISAQAGERASFRGDYVYQTFNGRTALPLDELLPPAIFEQLPPDAPSTYEFENEHYLDNAFLSFYAGRFMIRVGKQQLPWGTGYAWNPTDLFNVKSLVEPTYEKRGVDAGAIEIPFHTAGSIRAVFAPHGTIEQTARLLRIGEHFGRYDISATIGQLHEERRNFLTGTTSAERRRLLGGDFAGELFGLGVWGEGAYNDWERSDDYAQLVLGVDYTLENGTYLLGEYYWSERGRLRREDYTVQEWLELLFGGRKSLARNYLFLYTSYPLTELIDLSAYGVGNLDDRSLVLIPSLSYNIAENVDLLFNLNLFSGDEASEFGSADHLGFLRVTAYF